jgi:transcription initiation factor TFIID subunit 1
MSQSDDEDIGGAASLGINKILLDSGVDPESFSSLFSKTGGGRSSKAFAEVEAEDDDAKFMDDVSDSEMPADTEEEMRAKAARERDEARWYNRAMQMQREAEVKVKEQKRKDKEKILDVMEEVKVLWPDFAPGKRLKMSEVFYDSPAFRRALNGALGKRKRDDKVHIQRK